jgi:hypothetical protein
MYVLFMQEAVLRIRIHVFLGIPNRDAKVRGIDPDPDPALDPDPSYYICLMMEDFFFCLLLCVIF